VVQQRQKTSRNLSLLERACALQPDDPMRRAWLARELLHAGQRPRATEEAERSWAALSSSLAKGERPAVILPATLVAYLRLESEDTAGALAVLQEAMPWAGGHPNLHLLRAVALLMRGDAGDYAQATADLQACLRARDGLFTHEVLPGATSWAARSHLGVAAIRMKDYVAALRYFSDALSENPGHHMARHGAAEALLHMGRPEDALSVVESTLQSSSPDGWIVAASAAIAMKQFQDAATFLGQVRAPSTDASRRRLQASAQAALDGYALLREMTGIRSPLATEQSHHALLAEGESLFEQGDLDGAVERFVVALSNRPGSAEGWSNLGVGMHAAGLTRNAEKALQMALQQDPIHRDALESLGQIWAELHRPDLAAVAFRSLLDAHPGDPAALAALQQMGLQSHEAEGSSPLLSVVLYAPDSESLELSIDQLALQDLHPTLFEVFALSPSVEADSRAFRLQLLGPGDQAQAIAAARGKWLVLLSAGDQPSPDLLRRHLTAQVNASSPCAVQGSRRFTDSRLAVEPLAVALAALPAVHAPVHNLSLPRSASEALWSLRWRPKAAAIPLVAHDDIICWREESTTLAALVATAERAGREASAAWSADPSVQLPDVPGDTDCEESWLGMRMLYEQQQPLITRLTAEMSVDLDTRRALPEQSLGHVLQHARRRGLIEGSIGAVGAQRRSLASELTSIIIPNLNGMPHMVTAVESLRRTTPGPVELIVVDNGSDDGSLEWLRGQPDIHLLEMGENLGAPAARNRGLAVARGETIVLCDNDVVFTPGWRPALLAHLEAWPDIGMVGPMSDYVIGTQKLADAPAQDGPVDLDTFASDFHKERHGGHTYSHRLILFFLIARREIFDKIGGIDEGYGRWGFEDDDLCVRVRLAGYKMRVAKDCFIRHLGSQTAKSANLDYDRLLLENWAVFKNKWRLDPELPYGPYDPAQIMAQRFPPEHLYVPFQAEGAPKPSGPVKLIRGR
jgi:GT2 family glycosyltransferase/tetratricopeptide (TPR) repeat protein